MTKTVETATTPETMTAMATVEMTVPSAALDVIPVGFRHGTWP
jgi:hypothetical protein